MKSRLAALLSPLLALALVPSPATAEPGWIPLGPRAGQRVVSLTVVPGSPSRVFAGAVSGVFRGSDGRPWELLNDGDGLPFGASGRVHAAPVPGGPVYLATDPFRRPSSVDGVFRSDDGGESWTRVKDTGGLLAVAPSDPSRLYFATDDGVETSRDGGLPGLRRHPFRSRTSAASCTRWPSRPRIRQECSCLSSSTRVRMKAQSRTYFSEATMAEEAGTSSRSAWAPATRSSGR